MESLKVRPMTSTTNGEVLEISSERVDDIPVIVAWLDQMELAQWIDESIVRPHGNHQGLSYGQGKRIRFFII